MKKLFPLFLTLHLSLVEGVAFAAESHDHSAMPEPAAVATPAGHDVPMMQHAGTDDAVVSAGFQQLEWQKHAESEALLAWDFSAYVGNEASRWWLKSEGAATEQETEEAYVQLAYSQPLSPFWDLQLGLHAETGPVQGNYLMVGLFGLAPWFVDMETYLLLNSEGDVIWQLEADYDLKLSRHWVLLADAELSANAQHDREQLSGSGLAQTEFGLRLAYERVRKLVPYVGVEWERSFGATRDYLEKAGEDPAGWVAVLGLNLWY